MAKQVWQWEKQAYEGEPLPAGLPAEDQAAYIAMRYLYKSHKRGQITREQAAKEKGEIRHRYTQWKEANEFNRKLAFHHASLMKSLESAASDYAKDRTPETAEVMYRTLYGFMRGKGENA